jgi:F-type H+-transporting ATPase subunit delta
VREPTIARNYAEALLLAARETGEEDLSGELLAAVAGAVKADPRLALALELPRISKATKLRIVERALADIAPPRFVRFMQSVVRRGRQSLLGEMSNQYQALLDRELNRVHARVTIAREPEPDLVEAIRVRLEATLEKTVIPHVRVDPHLLGGVVIRVGERVFDGSLRRRLRNLRRAMVSG